MLTRLCLTVYNKKKKINKKEITLASSGCEENALSNRRRRYNADIKIPKVALAIGYLGYRG